MAANSDWISVGGTVDGNGTSLNHNSSIDPLNLHFTARYVQSPDSIRISASVTDLSGTDRAISLYFALPINATVPSIEGFRTDR